MITVIKKWICVLSLLSLLGCAHNRVDERGEWRGVWNTVGAVVLVAAALVAGDLAS